MKAVSKDKGKPESAANNNDELERLAHTPRFRRLLDAAEQRIRKTGGIKHEDFWSSIEATQKKSR